MPYFGKKHINPFNPTCPPLIHSKFIRSFSVRLSCTQPSLSLATLPINHIRTRRQFTRSPLSASLEIRTSRERNHHTAKQTSYFWVNPPLIVVAVGFTFVVFGGWCKLLVSLKLPRAARTAISRFGVFESFGCGSHPRGQFGVSPFGCEREFSRESGG